MTSSAAPPPLGRWNRALLRLLEAALVLLVAGLVLDVLWQVVSRYVLQRPSSWTDELATLLILWVASLGSAIAFVQDGHLGMDYVVERLAPRWRRLAEGVVLAAVALFAAGILIGGGLRLVTLTLRTGQVSPVLGLRMGHVYLALPLAGACILSFTLELALTRRRRFGPSPAPGGAR